VIGCQALGDLFLGVPEMIKTKRSGNDPRRIFNALDSYQRGKKLAAVSAEINLQLAMGVRTQTVLDYVAPSHFGQKSGFDWMVVPSVTRFFMTRGIRRVYSQVDEQPTTFAKTPNEFRQGKKAESYWKSREVPWFRTAILVAKLVG